MSRWGLVVLGLAAVGCSSAMPKQAAPNAEPKQECCDTKPSVELKAYPAMAAYSPLGVRALLRLTIRHAEGDESLYCPKITWELPNGTTASEESDCEPFESATVTELDYQTWTRPVLLGAGLFEFRVRIEKNGKLHIASTTVNVIGGGN